MLQTRIVFLTHDPTRAYHPRYQYTQTPPEVQKMMSRMLDDNLAHAQMSLQYTALKAELAELRAQRDGGGYVASVIDALLFRLRMKESDD